MCLLGIRLRDVPETIGWSGLAIFYRHLDERSATWRAQHGDVSPWTTVMQANAILADVCDVLQWQSYNFAKAHTARGHQGPRRPSPYPRPWKVDDGARHVGGGAIPRAAFLDWYYGEG